MSRDSVDELERIRRGLEAYLADEENVTERGSDRAQSSGQRSSRRAQSSGQRSSSSSAQSSGQRSNGSRAQSSGRRSNGSRTQVTRAGSASRHAQAGNAKAGSKNTGSRASSASNRKYQKKKRKKKSGFKKLLLVLLVLFLAIGGIWYYTISHFYGKMNFAGEGTSGTEAGSTTGLPDSVNTEPMKEEGVINILLIGNDSRDQGTDGRSDAMILLSVSSKTKTIHLTSLLRDMYVEIPGHDNNRLNAAYAYGGPELLMETLEQNLDIHVNRYVLVNFQAFAKVVDAVGGVDLELTAKEIEYVNGYLVEYNMLEGRPEGTDYLPQTEGGMVHLNGPQALSYCRNRLIGTDFGRTERQRKVLTAIIQKAPSALLTNFSELVDSILPNLTTNLTEKECRSLSLQVPAALSYDIIQGSIPLEGTYSNATIRGMSVLEVDFEANKEYLRTSLYEKP